MPLPLSEVIQQHIQQWHQSAAAVVHLVQSAIALRLQPFMFKMVCKLFKWFTFTIYLLVQYYEVNTLNRKQ